MSRLFILLPLLIAPFPGCAEPEPMKRPPVEVSTSKPVVRNVFNYFEISGRSEASAVFEARARVPGTLMPSSDGESRFTEGNRIPANTKLFLIEPAPYEAALEAATARLDSAQAELELADANYQWSGTAYQEVSTGNTAAFIYALSVVLVYLFLCALYEAWFAPWAVIFTVPFAILGGIAFTAVRGYDINVYTQIGIVLLIGLSTKTAILIVEFAKQLHEEGKTILEAAEIAADLRFRAILMTAFSFILGVIPLVVASGAGAGSRRALGTAVFGGMSAATLFGVFVIPALYVVVQSVAEWRQKPDAVNSQEG